MSKEVFQPRYVNYARMHGKTPEEMLHFDRGRGGAAVWFSEWVRGRWADFDEKTSRKYRIGGGWSEAGHRCFDRWLDGSCASDPNSLSDE